MSRQLATDPVLRLLAGLPSAEPRPARDAARQARYHALLAESRSRGAISPSRLVAVVDSALAVAVSLYGAIVLAEAVRLALR